MLTIHRLQREEIAHDALNPGEEHEALSRSNQVRVGLN